MDPKPRPKPVIYICGECAHESTLTLEPGVVIQCPNCAYGLFYKKRIRKSSVVQFEAR